MWWEAEKETFIRKESVLVKVIIMLQGTQNETKFTVTHNNFLSLSICHLLIDAPKIPTALMLITETLASHYQMILAFSACRNSMALGIV